MSTVSFMADLQRRGIRLYAKAGQLAADAAPGMLTAGLIEQIRDRKAEILDLLDSLEAQAARARDAAPPEAAADAGNGGDAAGDGQLSDGQQQMVLASRLAHHAAYHLPALFAINGALDTEALAHAFAAVLRRHETLRTRFVEVDGLWLARVDAADAFSLPVTRMSEPAALALARGEADRRFDLAAEWPCRVRLLRTGHARHLLVIVLHHVCCDGVSVGLLMQEIAAGYAAARAKSVTSEASGLSARTGDHGDGTGRGSAPARRFADFVRWQQRRLGSREQRAARDYWRERFARPAPALALPADRPGSAEQPAATLRLALPAALRETLDAHARQHRLTRFTLLVAGFAALLGRYAGEEDVVIGTPVANRTHAEWQALVGFVANTVALRFDCAADRSIGQFLEAASSTVRDALVHADLPFEQVLRAIDRPAGAPLFQAMFAMQPASAASFSLDALSVTALPLAPSQTKFDLTLLVEENGDDAELAFEYRADRFDRGWIADLARRYLLLLERLVANASASPEQPLGQLDLIEAADFARLSREWSDNAVERPPVPVHALVAAAAARTPQALAIVAPGGNLCYGELDALANRYAHALIAAGVAPGDRVGVCLPPSARLVAVVLAIGMAGAAYIPMDPAYPAERLQAMVDDARPTLTIVEPPAPVIGGTTTLALEQLHADAAAQPAYAPDLALAPGADPMTLPLYVIFTSGSTGRPKGAVVTQRNFVNLLHWYADTFGFHAYTRVLLLSALSFDLTQKNLFAPLLHGGTLVIKSRADFDAPSVVADIARQRVSVVNCTPSMFYAIVEADAANGWRGIETLRHAFLGGEPISLGPLADWLREAPQRTEIVNTYGPTECSDVCAYKRLPTSLDHWPAVVPIGAALPGFKLVAVDEHDRPVPDGMAGELLVGGIGVGDGYVGRPELNAERFFVPAFAAPGERFYRTGDRVRRRPDGDFVFLGRRDLQTKLRGFRIELGEIEAVLEAQPGVARAAASVRRGEAGDERLLAFVVAEAGAAAGLDAARLLGAVRGRLPAFAVPQAIVPLAALPLTPSGKLDRRALAALDAGAMPTADAPPHEAPQGALETCIAEVWCELLGLARVGRHDSFFALGGHSLLATRAVTRLVNHHGLTLDIGDVFEAPTVRELAERLAARGVAVPDAGREVAAEATGRFDGAPIARRDAVAPYPLSPAQQRMAFLARVEGSASTYNMSIALKLVGPLDVAALGRALDALVTRHPVLSVAFSADGESTVQTPCAPGFAALAAVPVAPDALADAVRELANRPFDLARDTTLRAHLLATGADQHVLVLSMHHIVCDGWSAGIVRDELGPLYAAARAGTDAALPALPVSYFDYAQWHRDWLSTERLARLDAYWTGQLAGLPELSTLPTDYRRPEVALHAGRTEPFVLPDALSARLAEVAREHGASRFMLALAAFQALVARLTHRAEVVVGTPVANRLRPELEGLVGLFVNTLVIRQQVDETQPFNVLLDATRRTLLDAYAHQDMPFERLVEQLKPARHLAYAPLFQILFVMDTGALDGLEMPELAVERIDALPGSAKYDLNMHLLERDGRLSGYVEYDTALFAPATIRRLIEMYRFVLEQVTAAPQRPLHELSLLSPALADELAALPARVSRAPREATIVELVRASAARWPDRAAVIDGDASLSYAGLLEAAERVAGALLAERVPREAPVGVLMGRSTTRAVALLGTLVAGCAYVPLDPEWPDERIRQILHSVGIAVLLTEAGQRAAALGFAGTVIDPCAASRPAVGAVGARRDPAPADLAYVITTSGSTGTPKSVMVPHRGVAHDLVFLVESREVRPEDRVLQITNFNFDPSVRDLFGAWSAGAAAVLLPPEVARDPAALLTRLARERISKVFSITPTLLRSILTVAETRGAPGELRLDTLMPCGERLSAEDCMRAWAVFGDSLRIVNQYGPTEATMTSANHLVTRDDLRLPRLPVGPPNPNTQVRVLDAHRREVPVGTFGEVHIDGIGITRGYANDTGRTAEAFIPNPFAARADAHGPILYRTGDIGRRLDDGSIDLMGRTDAQVKIRGNRVEPGEVEAALGRMSGVEHAAVKVFEDADGQSQLAAYVVLGTAPDDPERALRRHLERELPSYMVPVSLQVIDAMPTTITGKIDRRRLPEPVVRTGSREVRHLPASATEAAIAQIWAHALGHHDVDTRTSFFELGGNSMQLISVQAALLARFGRELPIVDLFRHPTVELLAAFLDAGGGIAPPGGQPGGADHDAREPLLSAAARRRIEQRKHRNTGATARRQGRNEHES
ncbi:non-ribosomal peptide synthetase [Burkholderia glumae]|uniref:non-ribosomal peptide synthetase n=1 Tax=Burkholderia glumae TaxID=337 RepID=UPI0020367679|nr:amino acid adenylation domain-containing protein [Burkholderia glumae]